MENNPARLHAKLKWEAACERMAFALDPPEGARDGEAPDLDTAVRLAQAALEALRSAFNVGNSAHDRG